MVKNSVERRYLRVLEPWKGGHTPADTGFGNRLLHFDACYMLYMVSGAEHFLELETRYWNELKYIDLPGARHIDIRHHLEDAQQWLGTFDLDHNNDTITKLPRIGNEEVEKFLKTGTIDLPEPRYYFKFDWDYVAKILEKAKELKIPSGLKRVKIRSPYLRKAISHVAVNAVGIHMRRGNGVWKSKKDYAELPPSVKDNEDYNALPDTIYKYWSDDKYISLMKEMVEIHPEQKFYISCDLLDEEYEYLRNKFPGKIYTRKDVVSLLPKNFIEDVKFNTVTDLNRVAIESVIDMYTLANSSFILGSPHSTWLDSILRVKNVSFNFISQAKDEILKNYIQAKETYTTII